MVLTVVVVVLVVVDVVVAVVVVVLLGVQDGDGVADSPITTVDEALGFSSAWSLKKKENEP